MGENGKARILALSLLGKSQVIPDLDYLYLTRGGASLFHSFLEYVTLIKIILLRVFLDVDSRAGGETTA